MLVFFVTQPSRLPLYMTADILHVSKALYRRILSFRKYRALSRNLETRYPLFLYILFNIYIYCICDIYIYTYICDIYIHIYAVYIYIYI